jgi:hypothetical protein
MVIEYQIKRLDLFKLLYYNTRRSKRTQLVLGGAIVFTYLSSLLIRYFTLGNLSFSDFRSAFVSVIIFIIGLPILLFLLAKTQNRWLSISQEGIETKIGTQHGMVSWNAGDSLVETKEYIYITGKSANAFSIPNSAFENNDTRTQFMELAIKYHNEVNNSTGQ